MSKGVTRRLSGLKGSYGELLGRFCSYGSEDSLTEARNPS